MHKFTSQLRQKHASLTDPSKTQQSPLSELQALVKRARKDLVDPVLEQVTIPHIDSDEDESDEDLDPLEKRRYEERMKILELKKRKVKCSESGLRLLTTQNVVFVRNDVEDETGEVDVGGGDDYGGGASKNSEDEFPANAGGNSTYVVPTSMGVTMNGRRLKPTQKVLLCNTNEKDRSKKKAKNLPPSLESNSPETEIKPHAAFDKSCKPSDHPRIEDILDNALPSDTPASKAIQKKKSETYKQAWTTDEQNLLEQLLQEIPDGEKFRFVSSSHFFLCAPQKKDSTVC